MRTESNSARLLLKVLKEIYEVAEPKPCFHKNSNYPSVKEQIPIGAKHLWDPL